MQSTSYIKWPGNNFGDKLNDIIFPSLGIHRLVEYKKNIDIPENCYLGLGTIIGRRINKKVKVVGSGSGGGERPTVDLDYIFVRGKLTCRYLGLDYSIGVGDTAYFLTDYIRSKAATSKIHDIGIIPHHSTDVSILHDKVVISPKLPIDEFIYQASQCKLLLCEAMHGAICADILRIPFSPVQLGITPSYFKWNDWASVLDINIEFGNLSRYYIHQSSEQKLKIVYQQVRQKIENEFYR